MRFGTGRTHRRLFLFGTLLGVFFSLFTAIYSPVHAATGINQQINFQGRLLNAAGATVPDGYYNIQFKIYQDGDGQSVGNTTGSPAGTLKWTESYLNSASQGVKVQNGFLSVQLGSITAFGSSIDWNQSNLWLSMNIGSTNISCTPFTSCTPDGEMVPMQALTTAVYALNAMQLGGLTSSSFGQLAQNQIWTGYNTYRPTTDSVAAFKLQNQSAGTNYVTGDSINNQLILGTASSLTGKLAFATVGGGTLTINPTSSASSFTITLPAETGTVCTTAAAGVCSVAGSGYVQLAPLAVQADATANNSIFINKTNATGNIVELQKNGTDVFKIDNTGNIVATGTYNSNAFNSTTLTFGGANPVVSPSTSNTGLTAQANGTGTLTLNTGGAGTVNVGTTNSTAVGIGNSSSTTSISGVTNINTTGSTNTSIGTGSNTGTVAIGNSGSTTNILGATNINNSGTANTAIGNATGTFALASNALNVTTTGAVSGVTTLATSSTINSQTISATANFTGTLAVAGIITATSLGTASNDNVVCRNGTNQLAACTSTFIGSTAYTLQGAYTNSTNPEVVLNATNGGLTLRNDATNSLAGNLLEVQDFAGTTTFFGVTKTGINTTLSITQTGSGANTFSGATSFTAAGTGLSVSNSATIGTGMTITTGGLTVSAGGAAITGTTTINTSGSTGTSIGTGTNSGAVAIGNSASTTNILGATNINTSGTTNTAIGASGNTTTVVGAININTSGSGTTSINTGSSTGNTAIGNATGTFALASNALNVTTAGAISGVTTIATSSTINSQTISATANFTGTLAVAGIITATSLGTASNDAVVCRNGTNQLAACTSTFVGTTAYTLQGAYTNSTNPEIVLNATNGGLTIRNDATNSLAGNLLEVQDNAGSATFFGVSKTAITTSLGYTQTGSGANTFSGTINTNTLSATAFTFSGVNPIVSPSTTNAGLTVQANGTGTLTLNTTGAGTVAVGTTNTTTVGIGNSSSTNTITGSTGITGTTTINNSGTATTTIGTGTSTAGTILLQGGVNSAFTVTNATGKTVLGFAAPTTAGTVTYNLPAGGTGGNTYEVCTTFTICSGYAAPSGFAATSLNNLSAVAINTSLLPASNNTIDVGSASLGFANGYFASSVQTPLVKTADQSVASTASADITLRSGNTSGATSPSGSVTIKSGNTTTSGASGAITIDSGSAIGASTGAIAIGTTNSTSVSLGNTGANTITTIGGGSGATAVQILQSASGTITIGSSFSGANVQVVCGVVAGSGCGFANNATDHSTTLGSVTGTSATVLQSGSGGLTLTGNITAGGTYNGNTFSSTALTFSGATPVIGASTANTGLIVRANGTGTLTLNTSGAGTIALGTTNSTTIGIGNSSSTNTILGSTGITGTTTINTTGTLATTIGAGSGTAGNVIIQGGAGTTLSATNTSGTSILKFAAPSTAGIVSFQLPAAGVGGTTYDICTTLTVCTGYSAPGANTALSNLASVAINTSLLPASNNTINVGSNALTFANGYFGTSVQSPLVNTFDQTANSTPSTGIVVRSGNASGTASSTGTAVFKSGDATQNSGALSIISGNSSASGNSGSITIDSGTVFSGNTGAILLGSANSRSITIGNTIAATQTLIQGGTGGTALSLQAGASGAINIGTTNVNSVSIGSTANTGTLTFGQSTAGETIYIGSGATTAATTVSILSGIGTAGIASLNLGNNTRVTSISMGNIAPSAARTIAIGNTSVSGNAFVDTINIATNPTTVAGGNTINIATGTPTGAGTNLVNIGSTANASTTVINGGTGSSAIQLNQATGGGIVIGNANTGSTVSVQCGAGTSSLCGFGNNANDHTTTIGSNITASATVIQSGTSGIALNGDVVTSGTINTNTFGASALTFSGANPVISASTTNTGITLQSNGTGVLTLNSSGAGTVNVGTTNTTTIGIGNITAATQTLIQGGTGASALGLQVGASGTLSVGTNVQTSTLNLGNNSASSITNINGGTGTTAVNVQVGNGGSINIGTTVQTSVQNIGNTSASSLTLINGGTSGNAIQLLQGTGGVITIGSAGAASTVAVLCGAGTGNCGFANNATDHTTTIGSATGTSVTNIQGGTGGITLGSATTISSRTTFTTGSYTSAATSTITQGLIDGNTAVTASATATSLTFTVPSPTLTTGGRLLFITNTGANAFTLNLGGSSFSLFPSSTATLLWNGTAWTSAGVDGGTLQNAYNNFNGGTTPEILLDATRKGIDIQDSNGGLGTGESLLTVRASATANTLGNSLFNVLANGKVGINIVSTSTTPTLTYDLSFGQVAGASTTKTIGVEAQTGTNIGGNGLTISSGTGNGTAAGGATVLMGGGSGSGAGATGGAVTLQGGTANGSGTSNGGNVNLTGGTAAGTGTKGVIQLSGGTIYTSGSYSSGATSTITQSLIDSNSTISASATAASLTFTVSSPTVATSGRILYITNSGANAFVLNLGISSFSLSVSSTATLLWNGTNWTSAGVDGGTLQNTYGNSIGGSTAEIKLDTTRGGLNIQDANTTIGADLLQVNASNGAGIGTTLFSVGNTGSALFRTTVDSVTGFQVQNNTGAKVLSVDTSARQMRIYENGGTTNYALVYYDTATTTANYTANTGTVAVGTGAGAISVAAGSGSAITITANAASTWRTTAGALTVQSGTSSDLILNSGSSIVSVNGSGVLKLGSSAGDPATCTVGAIVYNSTTNLFRGCQGSSPAWATLGTTTPTLQTVYTASTVGSTNPEIKLDTTRTGLDIQDADSTISGALFSVRGANAGGLGTSIFNVNSTGSVNIGVSDTTSTLLTLDTDTDATYNQGTATNVATAVNGAMFYSSTDHNFLCGTAGKWITCNGLLYSNTAVSTAINTCTTACAAFSTNNASTVPANYCQPGRSIKISAKGVYSTTAAPTLSFGIYYGTDPTVKANNILIGTASGTIATATGAAGLGWGVDFSVVCFSTTSMNGQGNAYVSATAATTNTGLMYTNGATTGLTTTTAKNFYIFPTWSASSASNTITAQQMIISGQ